MNKKDAMLIAQKVCDYWISQNPEVRDCAWERGVYFLGHLAAYEMTKKEDYVRYAIDWAEKNEWRFYDDAENKTINADNLLCGETYFKLMEKYGVSGTTENMMKTLEYQLLDNKCDYWWWIDAIFMALPFYNMMGKKTGNEKYFEKARRLYLNTRDERNLYDKEEHLWYRDEYFLPEKNREANGEKIFWGRGNGWVFAGLARALDYMGKENKYYREYAEDFINMAKSLKNIQNEDGSYNVSFFDKETYPYHESSSTVLITLGFYIGLRLNIIGEEYRVVAEKGFNWLCSTAMSENGRIGWCQDIAGWPAHNVEENLSKDYVVGLYLLVLSELLF